MLAITESGQVPMLTSMDRHRIVRQAFAETTTPTDDKNLVAKYRETVPEPVRIFYMIARPVAAGLGAYHGYRRNHESVGWGIGWFLLGGMFPIITTGFAFAQGLGKPKTEH